MNIFIRFVLPILFCLNAIADTPPTVLKVNGKIGNVVLKTADISELTNLYFTNSRAVNACTGNFEPVISGGTTSQYWRGDKSFQTLNTSVVPEGSNLYYTSARFNTALSGKTTTDLAEGSNLYYSQARFDTAFSGKTTTSLPEGSNLYYTQARFDTAFSGKTTDNLTQGTTNKYYATSLFNTDFATKTTTNLSEGSNLYYTQGRFDSAFAAKSTTGLSEGTNLYYTDARARASISGTAPISYNNGSGAISITQSTTSTDGYLSSTDWNTFNNKAPTASPAFTGVPTAPTASVGTNTTQLATTAFVLGQGFLGATGSMPAVSSTSLSTTTSATTTFVTALTTSITVTAASAPVLATCALDMTSATAASVATARVTINGVSGGSVTQSLTTATTQHLTIPNQNLSTALAAGTYTINCDFNRASGTGTVTVGQGSLLAVALQGTSSNGITALTGALQAGPGSGSQVLSGILPVANGGTHLSSTIINQLLYSSAANTIAGLATANTGVLVTSSTGVPSITACATANRVLRTNGTTVSCAQANLTTDVTGTLPFAQGGTGNTSFANQRIPFSNGTNFTADGNLFYDTTNIRLAVGGNSTATVGAVTANGNVGLQSFCSGSNNCAQIRNQSAYNLAMLNANDANVLGILVGAERSRGTQAARTQALSGDIGLNMVGSCYTGSGSSTGFTAQILYNSSEDCTAGANGGEMSFATTLNGTTTLVERARITNDGQAKFHYGVEVDTAGSQPTCDVSHRGTWWVIQGGAGVADILQICLKDASNAYNWVTK